MAVILVVEDGSIVAGANSYIDLTDARDRAEFLGTSLSADDDTASAQLAQAAYYNDTMYANCFSGYRVESTQPMQWPRNDAVVYGDSFANDAIPQQVIDAQVFTAGAVEAGVNLYPNSDGKNVASKTVGSISVSYFNNGKSDSSITITSTDNAIKPTLTNCTSKYSYEAYS